MSGETLRFAVVGHPNEGKSSVVSTLAEDDSVPVSAIPGETVVCKSYPVRIDGKEIVDFIDTPGFQNPVYTREWMLEHGGDGEELLQAFIDVHESQSDFHHDVELLKPIAAGAGIIYIVDGSRPVRAPDRAEMDILRKTGRTRMAIINCKDEEIDYRADWELSFRQNFNAYRVFNAHHATYRERIDLFGALKGVNPSWQDTMEEVIAAFKKDWQARTRNAADVIVDLLEKNVVYKKSKSLGKGADPAELTEKLLAAYQKKLSETEQRAHGELRSIFKHNLLRSNLEPHDLLQDDLFSERTWHLLGLKKNQLIMASALAGAAGGLGVDALLAGSSFGLFAAGGAAVGAISAYFGGEGLAGSLGKGGGLFGRWLGGKQVSVGPVKSPQLYFIMLDRALLYHDYVIHWAHGRRNGGNEELSDDPADHDEQKVGYVVDFTEDERKACSQHFKHVLKGDRGDIEESRNEVVALLVRVLNEQSEQ